jgi:hypothetical protein
VGSKNPESIGHRFFTAQVKGDNCTIIPGNKIRSPLFKMPVIGFRQSAIMLGKKIFFNVVNSVKWGGGGGKVGK